MPGTTPYRSRRRSEPPQRLVPLPFLAPVGSRLRDALAAAHAEKPFSPVETREVARRVAEVTERLGLRPSVYRGALDVGGAALDHVWVVVDDRVVDVAFPLFAPSFVASIPEFVAGDIGEDDLERTAHGFSLRYRVVGDFPEGCRYVGLPIWAERHRRPTSTGSSHT